jgi:hypothetical protein
MLLTSSAFTQVLQGTNLQVLGAEAAGAGAGPGASSSSSKEGKSLIKLLEAAEEA